MAGSLGEQRRVDFVTGQSRELEQRPRLRAHAREALPDHVAHAFGKRSRNDALLAALTEEPGHLVQKQRIALSGGQNPRFGGAPRFARTASHEVGRVRFGQAREDETRSFSPDARDELARLRVRACLHVAIRSDHEQAQRAELASQEQEERQGRAIGSVQVVEDEHDAGRVPCRRLARERRNAAPDAKAPLVTGRNRVPGDGRKACTELRHESREHGCRVAEHVRECCVIHAVAERRKNPEPREIGRRTARLPTAPPMHGESGALGERRRRVGNPCLADPWLTDDEQAPPPSRLHVRKRPFDFQKLPRTPDEPRLSLGSRTFGVARRHGGILRNAATRMFRSRSDSISLARACRAATPLQPSPMPGIPRCQVLTFTRGKPEKPRWKVT